MPWLKIDDQLATHRKWRLAGVAGRAVWMMAAIACAQQKTDGVVDPLVVKDAAYLGEVNVDEAVAALVACGLWHDAKTLRKCVRCRDTQDKLPPGAFYFHDWLEYQPAKDAAKEPVAKWRERRKRALYNDAALLDAIRDRDGTLCRYCGVRVKFAGDRRSAVAGTYDHVNPDEWNSLDNVVIACNRCNGRKGHRTPAEAGMVLLAPGTRADDSNIIDLPATNSRPTPGADPELIESSSGGRSEPGPELIPRDARTRPGSGQVGSRSGPTPGADPDGPGQVGSGPGPSPAQASESSDDLRGMSL